MYKMWPLNRLIILGKFFDIYNTEIINKDNIPALDPDKTITINIMQIKIQVIILYFFMKVNANGNTAVRQAAIPAGFAYDPDIRNISLAGKIIEYCNKP